MDEAMHRNCARHPPQFPMQLEMPKVPRAFLNRTKVRLMLCDIAEEFGFEEQQALYYYCFLDVSIEEIAKRVGLSQKHVASVLGIYSERLTNKLDVFKKALPYDTNDLVSVSEILSEHPGRDSVN